MVTKIGDVRYREAEERRQALLVHVRNGLSITDGCREPDVNVSIRTYEGWRRKHPYFVVEMDKARLETNGGALEAKWTGDHASFGKTYFDMEYASFQLAWLNEIDKMRPGNIVLSLWPPEHGKTTTYENLACERLAVNPNWRGTVASENLTIAKKIVGRIKHRMEPAGPFKKFVRDFGPFKPKTGMEADQTVAQPWSSQYFNVYKKSMHDERDYSLMALGWKSSIVSTRTDHLHLDDLQSVNTINDTNKLEDWVRQDALSRPGEHGITSIAGTRVGEDDVYERFAEDPHLDGILKVIKFPAIITDYTDMNNPVQKPLWPERYTLEMLERQRRKVGEEAWNRNYMQNPAANRKNATFTPENVEHCLNPQLSLLHHRATPKSICYVTLDPAIGGINCVMGLEIGHRKMTVRAIREQSNLSSNEQIMSELNQVVWMLNQTAQVTDVVIESMNFQRGLARDERLQDMQRHYGFAIREHLTGWNKYDEDIGVPSMVTSFIKGEIELPWAEDDYTRHEIGELLRQLYAWKPKARGSKLRQDRVMALWFGWILWRNRWKHAPDGINASGFKRNVPWSGTKSGLIVPVGAYA